MSCWELLRTNMQHFTHPAFLIWLWLSTFGVALISGDLQEASTFGMGLGLIMQGQRSSKGNVRVTSCAPWYPSSLLKRAVLPKAPLHWQWSSLHCQYNINLIGHHSQQHITFSKDGKHLSLPSWQRSWTLSLQPWLISNKLQFAVCFIPHLHQTALHTPELPALCYPDMFILV